MESGSGSGKKEKGRVRTVDEVPGENQTEPKAKQPTHEKTRLLSPTLAIYMTWARTGNFSTGVHSQIPASSTEKRLIAIKEKSKKDEYEKEYVSNVIVLMDGALRSLDVIYKGRELNFQENEKLRLSSLETVKHDLEFGTKAGDSLKSLPAILLGGAGGYAAFKYFNWPDEIIEILVIVSAFIGHFVGWSIRKYLGKRTERLYVSHDYDRSLYYDQYLSRVEAVLKQLYWEIEETHRIVFGKKYSEVVKPKNGGKEKPESVGKGKPKNDSEKGTKSVPTSWKYILKHLRGRKQAIDPRLWPLCETGNKSIIMKYCPRWKEEEPNDVVEEEPKDVVEKLIQSVRPTFCEYIHKHLRGSEHEIIPEHLIINNCPKWKEEKESKSN